MRKKELQERALATKKKMYKDRIFEMLSEIDDDRFIRMIFGYVNAAHKREKESHREEMQDA